MNVGDITPEKTLSKIFVLKKILTCLNTSSKNLSTNADKFAIIIRHEMYWHVNEHMGVALSRGTV